MTHIQTERYGAVGIIQMSRRESFNALDAVMARDLRRAALSLARDQSVRCVILQGDERSFCSGADLKYVRNYGERDDLTYLKPEICGDQADYGTAFKEILEYLHSTISEIRRAPKPFIAAVRGMAAAGGFGLAMCCDLVLASDRAAFEWAYAKTGLTGAESSTFLISRLIGLRRSFDLIFLNPRLSAGQAHQMGLITSVFPDAEFDVRVREVATSLASGPTRAWGLAKRLINEAAGMDRLDSHMDKELVCLTDIARGDDFKEGISAFFEKRPADFSGDLNDH